MPGPGEAADVILIDTENGYSIQVVDQSQGGIRSRARCFIGIPIRQETQFFFNDRDPETQKVFTVLLDISEGRRIREYRYEDAAWQ